jgi:hypothetical protein
MEMKARCLDFARHDGKEALGMTGRVGRNDALRHSEPQAKNLMLDEYQPYDDRDSSLRSE